VLTLDVNSVERLEMFLELLQAFGAETELVVRTTVDSGEELGRRPASRLSRLAGDRSGMSPVAFSAWARRWPDEAQPALEGMTPHLAAHYARGRILLEARLRDLEH
jgi:hypothetical protein